MANEQWIVQGFLFQSRQEYMKAKKEQEAIAYIKANSDLNNIKSVTKVYNKLTENHTFDTIIGITFLNELREKILKQKDAVEAEMKPILIRGSQTMTRHGKEMVKQQENKYKNLYEEVKHKRSISVYLNIFLAITVIAMFMITYYSPRHNDSVYEQEILDKYSTWKAELQQKEDELNAREKAVNAKSIKE